MEKKTVGDIVTELYEAQKIEMSESLEESAVSFGGSFFTITCC